LNRIKAIIFDMDGVIFDTESIWKRCFGETNRRFGVALDEEYRKSICGKSESVIRQELRALLPWLDADAYREDMSAGVVEAIETGAFETKKGFGEFITFCREKGYRIALATSTARNRAEKMFFMKGYDIDRLFDATAFGDEVGGRSKPDPYIFQLAAERLGVAAEHCLVIEDSINGIHAAVNGDFIPVMAVDLIEPDGYCREHCRWLVEDLEELKMMLQGEEHETD